MPFHREILDIDLLTILKRCDGQLGIFWLRILRLCTMPSGTVGLPMCISTLQLDAGLPVYGNTKQ